MGFNQKMSEREKRYFFCLLFPILWPLAFGLLIEDIAKGLTPRARWKLYAGWPSVLWCRMRRHREQPTFVAGHERRCSRCGDAVRAIRNEE